jgi:hypothetical protein
MDRLDLLILLVPFVLFPVIIFAVTRSQRRKRLALVETLRPEAAARGWTLEAEQRGRLHVIRWKGVTDGVGWIAESVEGSSGQGRGRRRTNHTRWRTTGMRALSTTTLFIGMPEGTEVPKGQPAGGMIVSMVMKALLAALDKGIDLYFGEDIGAEVNASELKRVEESEAYVPGFAVMATVPSEASRVIFQGVGDAINRAINSGPESLREKRRPWVLLWKGGVALGRVDAVKSAAEVEEFVRAGVAIARVVR